MPKLLPASAALLSVATALVSVLALPALLPLRVKLTCLGEKVAPSVEESVAASVVVPPKGPLAAATSNEVGKTCENFKMRLLPVSAIRILLLVSIATP